MAKGWVPHATDDLNDAVLRQKLIATGLNVGFCERGPEASAKRKRLRKLTKIARLEADATGEETW
jgi:hypothetical protein